MTTSIITPQIVEFARAVRAALGDLPVEERDELTDGLEADLAEAFAEDLARELPDPDEYATELRNAAGLPKVETSKEGLLASLAVTGRRAKADLAGVVRRNPALVPVADFLVSIRPLWWVARAWVASWLVAAFFGSESGFLPSSLAMWAVLIAFIVISVQWGRGAWRFRGVGPVIAIGNVVAVVLLLPVVAMADDWTTQVNYSYVDGGSGQDLTGVYLDGSQVTNIFPYDASGKPLGDVQLFTQDGQPLRSTVDGADGCIDLDCTTTGVWVPRVLASGLTARNVYPMAMAPVDPSATDGLQPAAGAAVEPRPLPFPSTSKVLAPEKSQTSEKVAPNNE